MATPAQSRAYRAKRRRRNEAAAPVIRLGSKDPMSITAKAFGMPLCEFGHPWAPDYSCTRAAGHDEASITGISKRATVHVCAPHGWVEAIW